ncbi:MAG TPA: choice-of-anchor C family protein [Bryobacteraceae bacterium]|nr:choice-of-anchor C family protein [Bryobacteraceae bacterium]
MFNTKLASFAVALVLAATLPAANLLVNGSFEQGPNPGSYTNLAKGSTAITGWTVSLGNIDYIGSLWVAADGSRSLDLEGSSGTCNLSIPNCPGGIAQSFATVAGQGYVVTFALAGNVSNRPVMKTIRVSAAGQSQNFTFTITGHTAAKMGWVTKTWTFTATGSTTTLEFDTADSPPTGWGPALDNVSVSPVSGVGSIIFNKGVVNGASYFRESFPSPGPPSKVPIFPVPPATVATRSSRECSTPRSNAYRCREAQGLFIATM